jgi:hypothetical protein
LLVLRLKIHIYILNLKIKREQCKEKITMKGKRFCGIEVGTYWSWSWYHCGRGGQKENSGNRIPVVELIA